MQDGWGVKTQLIKFIFFFFSSRRRHTRFDCDWSSDVCSSDLEIEEGSRNPSGARLKKMDDMSEEEFGQRDHQEEEEKREVARFESSFSKEKNETRHPK